MLTSLFLRGSSPPKIVRARLELDYGNSNPVIPTIIVGMVKLLFISHILFHGSSTAETIQSVQIASTIVVAKYGSRDFSTVQEAIDSVPPNNDKWIRIHIKLGVYAERVTIPQEKPFIYLEGDVRERTVIEWGLYGSVTNTSVFTLSADNFRARNITFKNTYNALLRDENFYDPRRPISQAPAAMIWGDKVSFYNCSFISLQDTLSDMQGRHYFESCYIEGSIDFIWGGGKSQYFNCILYTKSGYLRQQPGYITAQGRSSPNDTSAYVFISGSVIGEGSTYLGRAYGNYSTVIFYKTDLSNVVTPLGWNAWNYVGKESTITYVEEGCTGSGSNKSGRVPWMKSMSPEVLDAYININNFINQDGWLQNQP